MVSRSAVVSTLAVVVAVGLAARLGAPGMAGDLTGGALYVVAVALAVVLVTPRVRPSWAVVWAVLTSCAIEGTQATGALTALARAVPPARWVLGTSFAWLDLAAYVAGGPLAYAVLSLLRRGGPTRAR